MSRFCKIPMPVKQRHAIRSHTSNASASSSTSSNASGCPGTKKESSENKFKSKTIARVKSEETKCDELSQKYEDQIQKLREEMQKQEIKLAEEQSKLTTLNDKYVEISKKYEEAAETIEKLKLEHQEVVLSQTAAFEAHKAQLNREHEEALLSSNEELCSSYEVEKKNLLASSTEEKLILQNSVSELEVKLAHISSESVQKQKCLDQKEEIIREERKTFKKEIIKKEKELEFANERFKKQIMEKENELEFANKRYNDVSKECQALTTEKLCKVIKDLDEVVQKHKHEIQNVENELKNIKRKRDRITDGETSDKYKKVRIDEEGNQQNLKYYFSKQKID